MSFKGLDLLLYSRYRKFNLFGEEGFSITPEAELSVFDTDFGVTFGIFTCFDIVFEEPAISLAKILGVRDFVFPTAWYSELPFLTGKSSTRQCSTSLVFIAFLTKWVPF
jgi:predicted amidohydrolase